MVRAELHGVAPIEMVVRAALLVLLLLCFAQGGGAGWAGWLVGVGVAARMWAWAQAPLLRLCARAGAPLLRRLPKSPDASWKALELALGKVATQGWISRRPWHNSVASQGV